MASFKDKISNLINSQAPEFVVEQHPKFLEFVKTYYSFMESAELAVTSVQTTDGIQLETETAQSNELVLDASRLDTDRTQLDAGDKILLESSAFGKFTRGETITGQTSNATATILGEDLDNGRLFISAQDKFVIGEIVLGSSSNASAIINNYRPNPVTNIQELLNFRDPDKVISNFLTKFRNEFLNTLPETLLEDINKRTLIKNIKSLYRAKGTNRGHEVFFKLLFGSQSETIYPREQMLRVSDGKWETKIILRVITVVGNTLNLIGRQITGLTSGATAIVENVFKFRVGANEVSEFILNTDTITGTFQTNEEIRGTSSDEDDVFIKANITGIPDAVTFTNDGTLYEVNESIGISGGGNGAIIQVDTVGTGGITDLYIDSVGSGYSIGDELIFDNSDTTGSNASGFISVVNGGIQPEDGTDLQIIFEDNSGSVLLETASDGLSTILLETDEPGTVILEDGFKLVQEESATLEFHNPEYLLQDTDYSATNENHIVLETKTIIGDSYNGDKLVQEEGTGIGDITDLHLREPGNNYNKLPTITINNTSELGSGAKILCYGNEIGRILKSKIVEHGAEYEKSPSPTLTLRSKLIVLGATGDFSPEGTVTGETSDGTAVTATVVSFDSTRGLLTLTDATGIFGNDTIITDDTLSTTATVKVSDTATATTTVGPIATTTGEFINQDGHVSDETMRIQDSLYYQDYSYVIKVGQSINIWRDSFKKTIHTGGFYVTGQVNIETIVNAGIRFPVEGIVSGTEESPIFGVLTTLFTTIFGRRLGTEDDGTTLRINPKTGVDPLFDDSTTDFFTPNTRDLTLVHKMLLKLPVTPVNINFRDNDYNFGYAYCGPRLKSLNIYNKPFDSLYGGGKTLATYSAIESANPGYGVTPSVQPMTMAAWAEHRIIGLNNSLNGERFTIEDYGDSDHDNLKTFVAIPTEIIRINEVDTFDSNVDNFDSNTLRFDEG